MAARDPAVAEAVAHALLAVDRLLILFAPGGSALAQAGETLGLRVAREVFADRNYLADGSLVPRTRPDALLHNPEEAAARVLRMLREEAVCTVEGNDIGIRADMICVNGKTRDAVGRTPTPPPSSPRRRRNRRATCLRKFQRLTNNWYAGSDRSMPP
jgi:UPF0271 protein